METDKLSVTSEDIGRETSLAEEALRGLRELQEQRQEQSKEKPARCIS